MTVTTPGPAGRPKPPREPFRLSMLIYDSRYRSLTIQLVVLLGFVAGAAWLIDNTINNLRALNRDFSFRFLWQEASYDINQRLIEYNAQMSHGRAALVGLLNTLLVAFLGCILATVVGVLAGVLRLSKNWIVARLMTVYVEVFRNIPTLLWILIIFAIMTEAMPTPRDFRGENPTASMYLWDSVAITNRGVYIPAPVFQNTLGWFDTGLFWVNLDILAILVVVGLSIFGWRLLLARATRIQNATGVRPTTWWLSAIILIAPFAALLTYLDTTLSIPELRGFNFQDGLHLRNSLIALWFALGIYTGAFIAEIVRSGILAVSKGQTEAAYALGLRPGRTMKLVILPQALRVIVPPLISNYLNLTKNTSLALAVGYMDLRSTLGGITVNQTGRELEGMLLMMLTYLVISLIISAIMNLYNRSILLKER